MTKRINKIYKIILLLSLVSISLFLIIFALRDNVIFFYSPSEIITKIEKKQISHDSLIRLGGLVLEDSFTRHEKNNIHFIITDNLKKISVSYNGILPDLFEEGQGVIAEGFIKLYSKYSPTEVTINSPISNQNIYFEAKSILAKHDENYMPPEVAESLIIDGYNND